LQVCNQPLIVFKTIQPYSLPKIAGKMPNDSAEPDTNPK